MSVSLTYAFDPIEKEGKGQASCSATVQRKGREYALVKAFNGAQHLDVTTGCCDEVDNNP